MNYQFEPDEPAADAVRRIASGLLDTAIRRTQEPDADRAEVVHKARRDCRKLRALLRLLRPVAPRLYRIENRQIREATALLSPLRDADVAIETFDALLPDCDGILGQPSRDALRAALEQRRQALAAGAVDREQALSDFRSRLAVARARVPRWQLSGKRRSGDDWRLLAGGLRDTYGRGRRAMKAAYSASRDSDAIDAFHEWRKSVEYLRCQLRMLRPAWPRLLQVTQDEVRTLGQLLGEDHDLAVLREVLASVAVEPGMDNEILPAVMTRRSEYLRHRAHWLGLRLYGEKPAQMSRRIHGYWSTMRAESANPSQGGDG